MNKNEILRLAWRDTQVKTSQKIIGSLGVGMIAIIFTWFAGLRTWDQAAIFILCSIAGYLIVLSAEFAWHGYRHWRELHNRIVITTLDELLSHYSIIRNRVATSQHQFDDFKDIYEQVERCWQEQKENRTNPETIQFSVSFPNDVITVEDIRPIEDQLRAVAANLAQTYKEIQQLFNFAPRLSV